MLSVKFVKEQAHQVGPIVLVALVEGRAKVGMRCVEGDRYHNSNQ